MKCARCQQENPPQAKFCIECAAPLARACGNCGTPLPAAAKFCPECAQPAGAPAAQPRFAAPDAYTPKHLAGKLLHPVLERLMEAVHHYEGTVNQVMGDGIMALFGAPLAHEDHAVRACYAALRMQERVSRYGAELQRSHGAPIQIRIGINSGEVVVRSIGSDLRMDYTALGQTTHLAARMEQMAKPGSALLTADTLRLAEG